VTSVTAQAFWRRCSNCKSEIALNAKYWICSVSTCQRVRSPIQFCKPDCWAVHNESENHRDGWAIEKIAPKTNDDTSSNDAPRGASTPPSPSSTSGSVSSSPSSSVSKTVTRGQQANEGTNMSDEVLVVVSRLKEHIQQKGGLRTSDEVASVLSDHLRKVADAAVDNAKKDGRKTVLARDVGGT